MKEYWIVLGTTERQVEVYRRPESGRYQERRLSGPGETIQSAIVPGVLISLSELFAA